MNQTLQNFIKGTLLVIPVILFIWVASFLMTKPHEIHIHAGFQIYLNGELQNYSEDRFMNYTACSEDGSYDDGLRTHLHNNVGDVLHVHKSGTTWRHFLEELGFDYKQTPTVAILNGENVGDYLDMQINNLDSIIIVAGEYQNFDKMTLNMVTQERIIEVSTMPELCGI